MRPSIASDRLDATTLAATGVALVTWSSAFAAIAYGLEAFTPPELSLLRFLIASAILVVPVATGAIRLPPLRDWPAIALLGLSGITLYQLALGYAKERVQFGTPIAMNQGVSFLIADMAAEIEAARLLTWQAAWMIDQGYGRRATKYSSFAKRYAADTAMKVTTDAVQLLGGAGYVKDFPVERMMRDAKITQIYEGTNQIQRAVIARTVFGW